ncbi:hypothetical protein [Thorsellia kenyensis]|uniref:Uncharacterized protein n=1 Tax=Thorsellia kenyensis TaxID=1549888 RepID=A0ABV6C882_9GAMM
MNKKADIIPGISLAGINLGTDIDEILPEISNEYSISRDIGVVVLDHGMITIGHEDNGCIYSVMCNSRFKTKYKNILWAGMTVNDVLEMSTEQIAYGGGVVVNRIDGIGLPLPDGYDDFEKLTDFLSLDFVFEYLCVFKTIFDN